VAQELNVALGDSTEQHLAEKPTHNLAAYDAYLKGIEAGSLGGNPVTLRQAMGYFERAVALDTVYASAWARLSQAASLLSIAGAPSPTLAERARSAAERALALAPDRPEGHAALGDYYRRIPRDYARALDEYAQGERQSPSNAELFRGIGQAEQALGRWEPALQHLRQAQRLDPRSVVVAGVLTPALLWARRYQEALESVARWIALAPANPAAHEVKAMIRLSQGELASARAILEAPPTEVPLTRLVAYFATYYELFWILTDEQQQLLLRLGPGEFDDDRGSWGLALAGTAALRGDARLARAYGDSARIGLEEQLRAAPEDAQVHVLLGTALAYLGRKADAIREGEKGLALLPISKDAANGPYMQHQLARIYIMVGEPEKALDQLEPLLRVPYFLSPGWLRLDPTFDPLRQHPRFKKLVGGRS
jgi:serine/threonine-protein kinase